MTRRILKDVVITAIAGLLLPINSHSFLPAAVAQTDNIDALLKIIQQQPSANAYYELGLLYLNEGVYAKAREQLVQCIRYDPHGQLALRARTKIGLIYYRLEQYELAEQELQKVRLTRSNFTEANQILNRIRLIREANVAFNQTLFEVAGTNYQKVLAEDSLNQHARQQLILIQAYQKANNHLARAQFALEAGQLDTAKVLLKKATSLWKHHPQIEPLSQRLEEILSKSKIQPDSQVKAQPTSPEKDPIDTLKTVSLTQKTDSIPFSSQVTADLDSSRPAKPREEESEASKSKPLDLFWWLIGIFVLLIVGIGWFFWHLQSKNSNLLQQKTPETMKASMLPPDVQTGTLIGKYQIIEILKQGGMGLVVKARHPHFRKPVVIKSVLPELKQEATVRQRFLREANILFELDHTNIVRVTDLFEEDQQIYVVMQFVDGANLKEITEKEAFIPEEQAVPLILQACSALSYLHAHQIIHRDIKPENMMLERKTGILKLVDFGIIKPQNAPFDESLTSASRIAGTPKYMSPEQLLNDVIDTRSDLFSLGTSFYEMLTGQHPFESQDISIIRAILEKEPPPMKRQGKPFSRELEVICEKMLAKNREQRYQTADEIARDLNQFFTKKRSG